MGSRNMIYFMISIIFMHCGIESDLFLKKTVSPYSSDHDHLKAVVNCTHPRRYTTEKLLPLNSAIPPHPTT